MSESARNAPFGASEVGGTTVTAFTYPVPGLKVLSCSKGADGFGFCHKIAVESRDAESIRSLVGDASARTCFVGTQRNPLNVGNRCEGRDVRLRSVKPKMPIVCKALEIERWRGLVSLVYIWCGNHNPDFHAQFHSVETRTGVIVLSTSLENVHHSNEPHNLGNASESRVDTEVQTMPCAITSSTARAPTRYRKTTDKIQQQSGASGV